MCFKPQNIPRQTFENLSQPQIEINTSLGQSLRINCNGIINMLCTKGPILNGSWHGNFSYIYCGVSILWKTYWATYGCSNLWVSPGRYIWFIFLLKTVGEKRIKRHSFCREPEAVKSLDIHRSPLKSYP